MKKKFTQLGIAVLIAAIVFSFAACKHDSEPDSTEIRESGLPVTGTESLTSYDFAYWLADDPLSNYIKGTPIVQITGNTLRLELDAPKTEKLYLITVGVPTGITVTTDAKGFWLKDFINSTASHKLYMHVPDTSTTIELYYVDKDVTINGSGTADVGTLDYRNITLKRGWNYVSNIGSGTTYTYTSASQTLPSGVTWTVETR